MRDVSSPEAFQEGTLSRGLGTSAQITRHNYGHLVFTGGSLEVAKGRTAARDLAPPEGHALGHRTRPICSWSDTNRHDQRPSKIRTRDG